MHYNLSKKWRKSLKNLRKPNNKKNLYKRSKSIIASTEKTKKDTLESKTNQEYGIVLKVP